MTKKPSVKNKAWEKDRRDRLNKAFDELAKLLPKYDPSVVWSKNEIIQKAIEFIIALQRKQEDYLKAKDPKLFREYEEFVNCLKFYQKRNAQLTELLKNAKITLPPVILPQLLVDKPELLPKESVEVAVEKPKRGRKKGNKNVDVVKKAEEKQATKKNAEENSIDKIPPIAEMAVKPTAIITAFTREISGETAVIIQSSPPPEPPPIMPVKPIVIRLRKSSSFRKPRLIAQPTFRKCYPHPNKMVQWSNNALSRQNFSSTPRRAAKKRRCLRKVEPPRKRLKIVIPSEPMREQSVSPTAAYLLSFPVVTSSLLSGKNVENVENSENSVSLENLNNFFTTEEYNKFCDEKVLTPIRSPLPMESLEKPLISGKPMTVFTVSAITRPSSPKKSIVGACDQVAGKQTSWMEGNKSNRMTSENCYNFTNTNPMIGSTSMCNSSLNSAGTQSASVQYSSINAVSTTSVKSEPKVNVTSSSGQPFPRYLISPNSIKNVSESSPKVQPPLGAQKKRKLGQTGTKNTCETSFKLPSLSINKPPISTFCSPTKSFFYDLPLTQSQPITAFNFNLPPITSLSSTADPLISSTAAIKSHSFLGFPSIKTEFSWLTPNTTASLTPTTSTTTNFTPFDLAAAIVSETLTPISFTTSITTPKSSESTGVEVGNKQNLFLPYEDTQYTPTFTFSMTKPTDSQVYSSTSWKLDKSKEIPEQIFYDCEQSKPQQKSHVNWMTSPTTEFISSATALPLPPVDFGHQFTSDFPFGCRKDSYDDENQFINWSPTKPLGTDFSTTTYNFENFGSNEPPPNKTVKQIFSVSQLVDQTPEKPIASKKKMSAQKSGPAKQTFSNIYSAESLIAKKDNNRMTNVSSFYNADPQSDNAAGYHHNSSNYFFNYPNTQSCAQTENDYLGAYSTPSTIKTTSSLSSASGQGAATFDSTPSSTTTPNYFAHSISSSTNDPYDPTYFPSSNYNQLSTSNWNHATAKVVPTNGFNPNQLLPSMTFASAEPNSNVSGNVTNFNLSSICPEIDDKDGSNEW